MKSQQLYLTIGVSRLLIDVSRTLPNELLNWGQLIVPLTSDVAIICARSASNFSAFLHRSSSDWMLNIFAT